MTKKLRSCHSTQNFWTIYLEIALFGAFCERTTGFVCPYSVSNSSAAQSNSSSWTQKNVLGPAHVHTDVPRAGLSQYATYAAA